MARGAPPSRLGWHPRRRSFPSAPRPGAAASVAGVGMTVATVGPARAAQDATPAGTRAETLEVLYTPVDPVSIVRAGSGPPQRGDHFYLDAPIFAVGDVNGTQIGTYQCFGAWTAAADASDAPNQRLTTVTFLLDDGAIMGITHEGGANTGRHVGAVQGGTGRYVGALGTFQQLTEHEPEEGMAATPVAAGTPEAGQLVLRAAFDLMLPEGS